jgi:hypothetical protein
MTLLIPFEEKRQQLTKILEEQFAKSAKLEVAIQQDLTLLRI